MCTDIHGNFCLRNFIDIRDSGGFVKDVGTIAWNVCAVRTARLVERSLLSETGGF
jgi:hypothetical protein